MGILTGVVGNYAKRQAADKNSAGRKQAQGDFNQRSRNYTKRQATDKNSAGRKQAGGF